MRKQLYNLALSQYQEIIDHHNDGIYIDEALFFFGRFIIKLKETDKAKPLKIIFNQRHTLWKPEKTQAIAGRY
jgi:hypothetical protein